MWFDTINRTVYDTKMKCDVTLQRAEMKCDTKQTMKLEQLYKVGSEWVELMAW